MRALKYLIPKAIQRAGISKEVSATRIVGAASDFLDLAVLKDLRHTIKVVSYAHGSLKIYCEHTIAAHEVRCLEPGIVEAITTVEPRAYLRNIFVQVRSPAREEV